MSVKFSCAKRTLQITQAIFQSVRCYLLLIWQAIAPQSPGWVKFQETHVLRGRYGALQANFAFNPFFPVINMRLLMVTLMFHTSETILDLRLSTTSPQPPPHPACYYLFSVYKSIQKYTTTNPTFMSCNNFRMDKPAFSWRLLVCRQPRLLVFCEAAARNHTRNQ